ncbi:MAG: hypothetical protein Q4G48_08985 [Bacteroidia bacterium]|nr:hypothetical protein [Bacteroidia bacterium]
MWKRVIAGLSGAVALSILHEYVKKNFVEVPEFNEVGEEVIDKSLSKINLKIKDHDKLYNATVAGDILTNAVYYAFTPFKLNSVIGALGGLGAIALPKKLGLDNTPIAGTDKKKMITVGYYIFGAMVASGMYKLLTINRRRRGDKAFE